MGPHLHKNHHTTIVAFWDPSVEDWWDDEMPSDGFRVYLAGQGDFANKDLKLITPIRHKVTPNYRHY